MTFDAHILEGVNTFFLAAATVPGTSAGTAATSGGGNGNFFDVIVAVMLVIGLMRGKKRGMSEELLDVFKWLLVVVAAAYTYKPMGDWVANFGHLPTLIGYIASYLFTVMVITGIFATIKSKMGEKVFESDLFGRAEYPLGMLAGMVRYACMVIILLAVLNAFVLEYGQIAAKEKVQDKDLGMVLIPSKEALHEGIFSNSFTGRFARNRLERQLIIPKEYVANPGKPVVSPRARRYTKGRPSKPHLTARCTLLRKMAA